MALQHFCSLQKLILERLIVFLTLIHHYLLLLDVILQLVDLVEKVLNMIGLLEFFEHQPSVLLLSLNVEDILLNPLYYALILQITDRLFDE